MSIPTDLSVKARASRRIWVNCIPVWSSNSVNFCSIGNDSIKRDQPFIKAVFKVVKLEMGIALSMDSREREPAIIKVN
jgi:hypothetical protein